MDLDSDQSLLSGERSQRHQAHGSASLIGKCMPCFSWIKVSRTQSEDVGSSGDADKQHSNLLLYLTLAGALVGLFVGALVSMNQPSKETMELIGFPGEILLNILRALVLPLVMSSIIVGITSLGSPPPKKKKQPKAFRKWLHSIMSFHWTVSLFWCQLWVYIRSSELPCWIFFFFTWNTCRHNERHRQAWAALNRVLCGHHSAGSHFWHHMGLSLTTWYLSFFFFFLAVLLTVSLGHHLILCKDCHCGMSPWWC